MSTTAVSPDTRLRVTSTRSPGAPRSVPPPVRLTSAQLQELEAELRRELTTLDRRLVSERQNDSAEPSSAAGGAAVTTLRVSDTDLRRDLVAAALARLASGEYGTCGHCGDPIPFGRLLVMPEATHCLACSGRS
jgi:DnaK suppressor protein